MWKRPATAPILVVIFSALVSGCSADWEIPQLERRAQRLNSSVMCPVCPGESLDQSQHPLAVQMRGIVMEKLEQGWDESQIRQFFSDRYGPNVLLEPPLHGVHLLVWLAPPVSIAVAVGLLLVSMRSMIRRGPTEGDSVVSGLSLSAEEREEISERVEVAMSERAKDDDGGRSSGKGGGGT